MLRRMRETAAEATEEDRRAALYQRELVTPETERVAQAEVGGEGRVRRLARQMRRRVRDADADRVEASIEIGRSGLHTSQQGLGVRDRGRSREDGKGRMLARQVAENAPPERSR